MTTHAVIFAPLGQATRSEQIVGRLKNAIVSGLLEAHEQLPNEAELARLMGVSHLTIRDVLNILRQDNLIYTTRGRNGGSFISEVNKTNPDQHPLKDISSNYLADLGELHCAIMKHSIRLAVTRSIEKDIKRIESFTEVFFKAVTPETRANADMRCLLNMAANAQSPRLAHSELAIQAEWASLVAILYRDDVIYQKVVGFYEQILIDFQNSNESQASEVMGNMLSFLTEQLIEQKFTLERAL